MAVVVAAVIVVTISVLKRGLFHQVVLTLPRKM